MDRTRARRKIVSTRGPEIPGGVETHTHLLPRGRVQQLRLAGGVLQPRLGDPLGPAWRLRSAAAALLFNFGHLVSQAEEHLLVLLPVSRLVRGVRRVAGRHRAGQEGGRPAARVDGAQPRGRPIHTLRAPLPLLRFQPLQLVVQALVHFLVSTRVTQDPPVSAW